MKKNFNAIITVVVIIGVISLFMYAFLKDSQNLIKENDKTIKISKKESKKEKRLRSNAAKVTNVASQHRPEKESKKEKRLRSNAAKVTNVASQHRPEKETHILKSKITQKFPRAVGVSEKGIPVYFKSYNVIVSMVKNNSIRLFRCLNSDSNMQYYDAGVWLEIKAECKDSKKIAPYLLSEDVFGKLSKRFNVKGFNRAYKYKFISLRNKLENKIIKKKIELRNSNTKGAIVIDFNNKIKVVKSGSKG